MIIQRLDNHITMIKDIFKDIIFIVNLGTTCPFCYPYQVLSRCE